MIRDYQSTLVIRQFFSGEKLKKFYLVDCSTDKFIYVCTPIKNTVTVRGVA